MKDVLLIPDSRTRQAQVTRNRLLEQNMKHLASIQREVMRHKQGDIDALLSAITRLATSITQVVRLHHQIWHEDAPPDDVLERALRLLDLDADGTPKETAE